MGAVVERARMLREWRRWIGRVVEAVKTLYPDAEVYVIGSVAEGTYTGASDLDLLVVTDAAPRTPKEEAEAKVRIEELAGLPFYHPLEIHFATRRERERWLARSRKYIRLA